LCQAAAGIGEAGGGFRRCRGAVGLSRPSQLYPDRYASAELPEEVREYCRHGAAHKWAHAALDMAERKRAARAAPVFTSPSR